MKVDKKLIRYAISFIILLSLSIFLIGIAIYCSNIDEETCRKYFLPVGGVILGVIIGYALFMGGIEWKRILLTNFSSAITAPELPPLDLPQPFTPPTKSKRASARAVRQTKGKRGRMSFLVGIATKDYVILASNKGSSGYGAILSDEVKAKEYKLGEKSTMMCVGEDGDVTQFGDWIKRNAGLYSIDNGRELSPSGIHRWIRNSIALSLRSSPYLFRGFPGHFCYAIMDREYSEDMPEKKGMDLLKKCIAESKKRFVANIIGFKVVIIDKNGYRKLPDIGY